MWSRLSAFLIVLSLALFPLSAQAQDPEVMLEEMITTSILEPLKQDLLTQYSPEALEQLFTDSWLGWLAYVGFGITEEQIGSISQQLDSILNQTLPMLENQLFQLFQDTYTPEELIALAQDLENNPAGVLLALPPEVQTAGLEMIQDWKTSVVLPAVQSEVISSVFFAE